MLLAPLLLTAVAAFAEDGDVIARRRIPSSPEALYAAALDLGAHPTYWPAGCVSDWEPGSVRSGPGASARLVYHAGPWRRRLVATIAKAEAPRRIEVDHPGRKGFVTTWSFTPADTGTDVELRTWILAPPKPFRKAYFSQVRPAWEACHAGALQGLEQAVRAAPQP